MILSEFKTKYKKWLLQGHHPDTQGSGQNVDLVRKAYHVKYLTHIQKQSQVAGGPTSYQEFVADAVANVNYAAAFSDYFRALCGIPFEKFHKDWKK